MPLFNRADGSRPVERLSNMRRFMPIMIPRRTEAFVHYQANVPIGETLPWLERLNADRGDDKISFYHVLLGAMVRAISERPHVNRFVKGGVLYQRDQIAFSFSVKKGMRDDAKLTTVKVVFQPEDDIDTIARRVNEQIQVGRAKKKTGAEENARAALTAGGPLGNEQA